MAAGDYSRNSTWAITRTARRRCAQPLTSLPLDRRRFASQLGSWMVPAGPESDVVLSCRVRLARNLAGLPFVSRLDAAGAEEVCKLLREHLVDLAIDGETWWVSIPDAPTVLRLMLRERHLVSRDLAPVGDEHPLLPGRAAAFGASETVAVMVNEEDHLRLQAMASGFDLGLARRRVVEIDRAMEERVEFATTSELGYLTGCPTNVGTGLRASVMMHLPALGLVRAELEKVFMAAQRTGLAVRGMYGEGSRATGDLYQISNQVTLGRSETQLCEDLAALVPRIIAFERRMREELVDQQRGALQDRVSRSWGMLRTARAMPTDGALSHLSNVRLGLHLGLVSDVRIEVLNELGVQIQRGHLQALNPDEAGDGDLLEPSERDRLRAGLLRKRLACRSPRGNVSRDARRVGRP
jgi:protein arginine kinase